MVWVMVFGSAVVAASVMLPARRRLGRNPVVGIRTAATMRSDDAWRAGHRAAVLPTIVSAVVAAAAGLLAIALGHRDDPVVVIVTAVVVVLGALVSTWRAVRAARAVEGTTSVPAPRDPTA